MSRGPQDYRPPSRNTETARDTGKIMFMVIAGLAIITLMYLGYWWLAKDAANRRYEVNTNTQQYQAGLVAAEQSRAQDWRIATDPGQKYQIALTFCSTYPSLTQPLPDLVSNFATMCPATLK